MRQRSDRMGFWMLFSAWATIFAFAALFALVPNVFTFLAAIIIIGSRQLGLSILMHEASHGLLFRTRKWNETLGHFLAAAPLLISMSEYRKRHMEHHRFTRTDKDPENYLYTPFPVSSSSMTRKILRDLTGVAFVRTQTGIFRSVWGEKKGRISRLKGFYSWTILFYVPFISAFVVAGRMDLFLLMWLLPLATTQQLFLRIRNIAEHAAIPDVDDPLKNSRTTLVSLWERMTFAPFWVNYHIEHHMVPFVPCWRLPEVHRIMVSKGFGKDMEIAHGYREIIRLNTA